MSIRAFFFGIFATTALCGSASASASIPQSQRDALIALYNGTGGSAWNNSAGWGGQPGTECSWFGVGCDNAGSTVVALDLESNKLVGTLPAIDALKDLQALDLSSCLDGSYSGDPRLCSGTQTPNRIGGQIPDLGKFASLQIFNISGNLIDGSIPSLDAAPLLRIFDVSNNSLTGTIPALSGLKQIQQFSVGSNLLSGAVPSLAGLTSLEIFDVSGQHREIFTIATGQDLKSLGLTGTLPSLDGLRALRTFDVSGNALTGTIPRIADSVHLQTFSVALNKLTGAIPSLVGLSELSSVSAGSNQLTGAIPSLQDLVTLEVFSVEDNSLTGQIPALSSLKNLREFDAYDNQLSGGIPPLSGLASLQTFNVYNNALQGTIPDLAGLVSLQEIELDDNQLSGALPAFDGLVSLQFFSARNNQLSGQIPALGAMTLLIDFDVGNNQLTGPLPTLSGLSHLDFFSANDNRLVGEISSLTVLPSIASFDVYGNQLTGPIPDLGTVRVFSAGANQLSGTLPSVGFPTCYFDVSLNQLSGGIPPLAGFQECAQDTFDIVYDVSRNRLSGGLPALQDLSPHLVGFGFFGGPTTYSYSGGLTYFDVSYNDLSGPLPDVDSLRTLSVFNVNNNHFSGHVPAPPQENVITFKSAAGEVLSTTSRLEIGGGFSGLCPNNLLHTDDAIWDKATGLSPWYSTCASAGSNSSSATSGDSANIALSRDGSVRVFQSQQTDLTVNTQNAGGQDIYSTGQDGTFVLESIDGSGNKLIGTASLPTVSSDGEVIAFLFTPKVNGAAKDEILSQAWAGPRGQRKHRVDMFGDTPANGSVTTAPSLSSSGGINQLVFCSSATNLVSDDTNNARDIFLVDPLDQSSTPKRISLDADGKEFTGDSCEPKLSGDGNKLAFSLSAPTLFGTPARQIVVKELANEKVYITGQILRVTTDGNGKPGTSDSSEPTINEDGGVVAFTSTADLDGKGPPIGGKETYVSLVEGGVRHLKRLRMADGTIPNGAAHHPQLSDDGTTVVMETDARNFLGSKSLSKDQGASGQCGSIVITTNYLAATSLGSALCSNGTSTANGNPSISGDGNTTGFDSDAEQTNGNRSRNTYTQGLGVYPSTNIPNQSGDFSGQWFDPSQSGQGLVIDVIQPDANGNRAILLTWFVFLNGQPTWLQGAGVAHAGDGAAGNTIVARMSQVGIFRGHSFPLGGSTSQASLWGDITLTFSDANTGKMTWNTQYPGFTSGSMQIKHFLPVALPKDDVSSAKITSCYSGNWFNPAQSGHGFEFEVLPSNPQMLAVDWFAFDPSGAPVWLYGVGPIDGNSVQMHLILIDGQGAQFPPLFDPTQIEQHDWGTATFNFTDSSHGSVTWNSTVPGYGAGTQPLQPLFGPGLLDRRGCK